jgi:hypothetical protein
VFKKRPLAAVDDGAGVKAVVGGTVAVALALGLAAPPVGLAATSVGLAIRGITTTAATTSAAAAAARTAPRLMS